MKGIRSILISVMTLLAICYFADKASCTTYAENHDIEFISQFTFSQGSNSSNSGNSLAQQSETGNLNAFNYRSYIPHWATIYVEPILKKQLSISPSLFPIQDINRCVDYYFIILYPFHEFS